jgi:hypothetical protein
VNTRSAAWHGPCRLGLEFLPCLVQVDLRGPEPQRAPPAPERYCLHAKHSLVELDRAANIGHCQHQMIQPVDPHERFAPPGRAAGNTAGMARSLGLRTAQIHQPGTLDGWAAP